MADRPQLVNPAVSRAKLGRELSAWRKHEADYRRRGWILLSADDLVVEVAFLTLIPMGTSHVPVVVPTIRLEYDNYDLWPPSLTFIDVFTGHPTDSPLPNAWVDGPDGQPRNVLIKNSVGKQFICFPGTREFHKHPDHDGDVWELYRADGYGSLAVVCDRVHSTLTAFVAGVQIQMQPSLAYPGGGLLLDQARQMALQVRAAYDARVASEGERQPAGGASGS